MNLLASEHVMLPVLWAHLLVAKAAPAKQHRHNYIFDAISERISGCMESALNTFV